MARRLVKHIWGPRQVARWRITSILFAVWLLIPWLRLDGRPAIWLDVPARKFYILWGTFWPQDTYLLALLLITAALVLFAATSLVGRAWCTYACPQTLGMSLYREIERLIEGDKPQRVRLLKEPWGPRRIGLMLAKHAAWVGVSLLLALNLAFYFSPATELLHRLFTLSLVTSDFGFLGFFGVLAYLFFGHFQDMICRVPCPYGRFQSIMLDPHSAVVTYDAPRGEPRAFFRKDQPREAGDCVSCNLCTEVCPTGIDIRQGLNADCVACMRCVDACDGVMGKVGFDAGLIRVASEREMAGLKNQPIRPRTLWYAAVLSGVVTTIAVCIAMRPITQLDVIRNRSFIYQQLADGRVSNVYLLKTLNMDRIAHTYALEIEGVKGEVMGTATTFQVESGGIMQQSLALAVRPGEDHARSHRVRFILRDTATGKPIAERESTFIEPDRPQAEAPSGSSGT